MSTLSEKLTKISGYMPRKKIVSKHGGKLNVFIDSDSNTIKATSYGHWTFITEINGLYIFNAYRFSVTTSKHQWSAKSIMLELGLKYITVRYKASLTHMRLMDILEDKVNVIYSKENNQALSRATKHAVYTEDAFNNDLADIKAIAKALKISDKKLDEMLLTAQDKATEEIFETLYLENEKRVQRRQVQVLNNDLSAITL